MTHHISVDGYLHFSCEGFRFFQKHFQQWDQTIDTQLNYSNEHHIDQLFKHKYVRERKS